ncbi:MAG TPA: hypothetical protein PKC65_05175 [Pyrinomonadaceae bacterium]|nr:hypothetical protein [Pyrinomonadaceae bacterium]
MTVNSISFIVVAFVVGIVMLIMGKGMATADEEQWKGEHWWREFLLRPPGYNRAATMLVGIVFVALGIVTLAYDLLFG